VHNLTNLLLSEESERLGKDPAKVERAYHLLRILGGLNNNPKTAGKFSLRGGTAFNLFLFNIPRISQDIDLNYTAFANKEDYDEDIPIVDKGIGETLKSLGFSNIVPPATKKVHSWTMEYESVLGKKEPLSIDINYNNRVPLFPQVQQQSVSICGFNTSFQLLNNYDLVAGKFNALLTRGKIASRDVYDIYRILNNNFIDISGPLFRIPFMIEITCHSPMAAMENASSYKHGLQAKIGDLNLGVFVGEMKKSLSREALKEVAPTGKITKKKFAEMKELVLTTCNNLLIFSAEERDFVKYLREEGEIKPELLLTDKDIPESIKVELARRIETNSYLNFIQNSIGHEKAQEREAEEQDERLDSFYRGEAVFTDNPIQLRAMEILGTETVLTERDIMLINDATRGKQRRDPRLSREDAMDMCIRDIDILRDKANKRGRTDS